MQLDTTEYLRDILRTVKQIGSAVEEQERAKPTAGDKRFIYTLRFELAFDDEPKTVHMVAFACDPRVPYDTQKTEIAENKALLLILTKMYVITKLYSTEQEVEDECIKFPRAVGEGCDGEDFVVFDTTTGATGIVGKA